VQGFPLPRVSRLAEKPLSAPAGNLGAHGLAEQVVSAPFAHPRLLNGLVQDKTWRQAAVGNRDTGPAAPGALFTACCNYTVNVNRKDYGLDSVNEAAAGRCLVSSLIRRFWPMPSFLPLFLGDPPTGRSTPTVAIAQVLAAVSWQLR
jgi:hypothetical protein